MYSNMADMQKFSISRSDGDNQGFEKSRARSPLASKNLSSREYTFTAQ
jgi:hypothetical protein